MNTEHPNNYRPPFAHRRFTFTDAAYFAFLAAVVVVVATAVVAAWRA